MRTTAVVVALFAILIVVSGDESLKDTPSTGPVDPNKLSPPLEAGAEDGIKAGAEDGIKGEESRGEEETVSVEAMKRRLIEIWGASLATAINENFAYHGLSHNLNFAEAAQQQAKLLTARENDHSLDAFFGGLLHDAGYYRSAEHTGYQPICLKQDISFTFSPPPRTEYIRSFAATNEQGQHVKSNIGHEELSICWMLKLVYQLRAEASKDEASEVDIELRDFFSATRVRNIIAAILYTKFGNCQPSIASQCPPPDEKDYPFGWKYVKSPRIIQDIGELTHGGDKPRTKDFPDGFTCMAEGGEKSLFPIADWLDEDGSGRSDGDFNGDENLNKIFMNADFVQMAQERSLCTSMSLLHEIMAYEGQHTFLPFPSTAAMLDKVFYYILDGRVPPQEKYELQGLKYGKYNGYAGNVLAFLFGQDFFVQTIVQYEKFDSEESQLNTLVDSWNLEKNASVERRKIFARVAYEFLKLKFEGIRPFDEFYAEAWPLLKDGQDAEKMRESAGDRTIQTVLCGGVGVEPCSKTLSHKNSELSKENLNLILSKVGCEFGNVPKLLGRNTLSDWSGRYFGPEDTVADEIPLSDDIRAMLSPNFESQCRYPANRKRLPLEPLNPKHYPSPKIDESSLPPPTGKLLPPPTGKLLPPLDLPSSSQKDLSSPSPSVDNIDERSLPSHKRKQLPPLKDLPPLHTPFEPSSLRGGTVRTNTGVTGEEVDREQAEWKRRIEDLPTGGRGYTLPSIPLKEQTLPTLSKEIAAMKKNKYQSVRGGPLRLEPLRP